MSGGLILNFNELNAIYTNTSDATAVSSFSLVTTGYYMIQSTGYLYNFSPTIYGLGSNDLLMDDVNGSLRYANIPNILIDSTNRINMNLVDISNMEEVGWGTQSGDIDSDNQSVVITVPGATSSSFAFVSFQSVENFGVIYAACTTNTLTVSFITGPGNYTIQYFIFNIIS